ncbi:MAG: ABC transporter permease [Clostridia bacterium]|nr:ABC transporter permease [Clostridia bacterium]
MKTYLKTLARAFTRHVTRFLSIIFIVVVAVGFISGIGTSADKIRYSLTDYYKAQNVSDLILRTKDENGFKSEDITKLEEAYGKNNVNTGVQIDADIEIGGEVQTVRLYFLNEFGDDWTVNVPDIKEGEKPENEMQALCENSDNKIKGFSIGTDICLNFEKILIDLADEDSKETVKNQLNLVKKLGVELEKNISVEGIVQSPLTFANDGEPNDRNPEDIEVPDNITDANLLQTLDNVLYLSSEAIPKLPSFLGGKGLIPTNAVYLSFSDKDKFSAFDKSYSNYLEEQTAAVCGMLNLAQGQETVKILTLNENYSFVSLIAYADKVMNIGFVLMVAFLFVTALVVLSNMTRLLEEERGQIACLRTLGYSAFRIIFKYILFAMLATGIGGVASYFVGLGLAYLICYVFNYSFTMPPISSQVALPFFLIVFFVIVAATLIATLAAGLKMSKETPANLLRPKPPKAGKKVFLERIPLIWNRLSFKYKSTMRNVLRYMNRFIMTVVSVAVSTALVLAGLALLDVCLFGGIDSPSVMGIAIVVIVFAGLLTAVVIYTLTNINISERNRELATLKVLGYQDKEIAGYIYREVYIDTAVGILFGYPLSLGIMKILFGIMAVGSITSVKWFWWLAAPFLVLFFTFLVTMILTRKIVKIDMNESLKAIE